MSKNRKKMERKMGEQKRRMKRGIYGKGGGGGGGVTVNNERGRLRKRVSKNREKWKERGVSKRRGNKKKVSKRKKLLLLDEVFKDYDI